MHIRVIDISGIVGPLIKLIGNKYKRYKEILCKLRFFSNINLFYIFKANVFIYFVGLISLASIAKLLLLVINNSILL